MLKQLIQQQNKELSFNLIREIIDILDKHCIDENNVSSSFVAGFNDSTLKMKQKLLQELKEIES